MLWQVSVSLMQYTQQYGIFLRVLVLEQGWGTLILEGHSPAEFSSNPEKKYLTASWRPWLAASGVFD